MVILTLCNGLQPLVVVPARLVRSKKILVGAGLRFSVRAKVLRSSKFEPFFPQPASSEAPLDPKLRELSISPHLHREQLRLQPERIPDARLCKVSILGVPNAGKSVLANALTGAAVCPVSKRVHTTRRMATVVGIERNTQLVCVDTPGLVSPEKQKKHGIEEMMPRYAELSLYDANLIAVLVDVSKSYHRLALDPKILFLLHKYKQIPSILVMTKVDLVPDKRELFEVARTLCNARVGSEPLLRIDLPEDQPNESGDTFGQFDSVDVDQSIENTISDTVKAYQDEEALLARLCEKYSAARYLPASEATPAEDVSPKRSQEERIAQAVQTSNQCQLSDARLRNLFRGVFGWPHFQQVFPISALKGQGVAELRKFLVENARMSDWPYHPSVVTDQDPVQLTFDFIRSKLLDHVDARTAYEVAFKLIVWEINEHDILTIMVQVIADTPRRMQLLIGRQGEVMRKVTLAVNEALRNAFKRDVYLKMTVKMIGRNSVADPRNQRKPGSGLSKPRESNQKRVKPH